VPFITIAERIGMEKGLLRGIELCLKLKFGEEGLRLLPEIREIHDHEMLGAILEAIETAGSPDELRRIWTRKRRGQERAVSKTIPRKFVDPRTGSSSRIRKNSLRRRGRPEF
jgi:hypothetical protein